MTRDIEFGGDCIGSARVGGVLRGEDTVSAEGAQVLGIVVESDKVGVRSMCEHAVGIHHALLLDAASVAIGELDGLESVERVPDGFQVGPAFSRPLG